ncbi:MAG: carbohydrate ABC transporter permease [Bacillales bacterium]|jgi:multiple sugar transport system permease protein|nr:carbohydrate ABC transporter permease [Bacillales bacterium]
MSKKIINKTILYLILIGFSLIYLIPFWMVIVTSIKANNALATANPFVWFPNLNQINFTAFKRVFTTFTSSNTHQSLILIGIKNTLIILVPVILVGMFSSSVSAYAYAKLRFKGKKILFGTLIFSMMIPGIILMIPSYFIYDNLGLTNSFFPLIVPAMFGSATGVFFLRQSINAIPNEMLDAARIDGLGFFQIYYKIILPLSKPALIAQAILGIIAVYNDYLGPLLYLANDESKYTLQIALSFFATGSGSDLPATMAGSLISMLPLFVIYFCLQKYFISGITMSGMKD